MNWRQSAYLAYASSRGYEFPKLLRRYLSEYESGIAPETNTNALSQLLLHCQHSVPYYAELLSDVSPGQIETDPIDVLQRLPILTKQQIRANFNQLQSADNANRNCHTNTSGGSTGEPVRLIQDDGYRDASTAIQWMSHHQLGCPLGAHHVRLWGSERDLEAGTKSPKSRFFNWLTNTTWMNAFAMSPQKMRGFIDVLNLSRPRLVVAYAQSIYELARFAEREGIQVSPQRAVLTSAGTLYPFMRKKSRRFFAAKFIIFTARVKSVTSLGNCRVSKDFGRLPGQISLKLSMSMEPLFPRGSRATLSSPVSPILRCHWFVIGSATAEPC